MNDRIRRLPDAEQEVMQAIWACQAPVARTDIEQILFQEHPMALTTLLTLLTRLSEKGFITIEKIGRRSYYIVFFVHVDVATTRNTTCTHTTCYYSSVRCHTTTNC